jgi:lipopolysaccharide/colanic/teichoic acid biosynthesis glycosyltransferase
LESLEQRCLELQPGNLIVGDAAAHWLSPSLLWKLRLRGIAVSSDLDLYEEYFGRIHLRRWDPVGLLLSPTLTPNSQTLAVQAIYTNILGVALVLVTLPLILTLGLLILVTSGRPILDSEECSGFQNIPFLLLRFRTRDLKTGQLTLAGKLIETLHLKSLPNLFNILRGEIALFGPRPVRSAYTEYMRERLPLYTIRLAVKPGIMSWSPSGARIDELTRMEYDLYYVKLASIRFDVDLGLSYLWPDDRYSHSLDVPR